MVDGESHGGVSMEMTGFRGDPESIHHFSCPPLFLGRGSRLKILGSSDDRFEDKMQREILFLRHAACAPDSAPANRFTFQADCGMT